MKTLSELKKLVSEPKKLVKLLFGVELTEGQLEIVRKICYDDDKRVVISCFTRYGKTFAVSIGIMLYLILNENKRVIIIAPSFDQASIIRNYIGNLMIGTILEQIIEIDSKRTISNLKKEVSKSRITFNNGCELKILTAGSGGGLMGFGGDLIILDESCLVPYEVFRTKISRMYGDSPNSKLIEIGNPWHRNNHMWEHWNSPEFTKIHVDYKQGLKEGRITREFVEEQRKLLTRREFMILYEARFPEDTEDVFVTRKEIENAIEREFDVFKNYDDYNVYIGCDVARYGTDTTVITIVREKNGIYEVIYNEEYQGKPTTYTFGRLVELDNEFNANKILVDDLGVGGGVTDMLKNVDKGSKTVGFIASSKDGFTEDDKRRFPNWKSKGYMKLRKLFQRGMIKIIRNHNLINELSLLRLDYDNSGRVKILDYPKEREETEGERKSPNQADALMIACSGYGRTIKSFELVGWS